MIHPNALIYLVPKVGVEPTRYRYHWILSVKRHALYGIIFYFIVLIKIVLNLGKSSAGQHFGPNKK